MSSILYGRFVNIAILQFGAKIKIGETVTVKCCRQRACLRQNRLTPRRRVARVVRAVASRSLVNSLLHCRASSTACVRRHTSEPILCQDDAVVPRCQDQVRLARKGGSFKRLSGSGAHCGKAADSTGDDGAVRPAQHCVIIVAGCRLAYGSRCAIVIAAITRRK